MGKLSSGSNLDKKILIFIYLLIIILPLFTYWNSVNIPLISDDFVCMEDLSSWGFDGGKKSFFRPFIKLYFETLIPIIGKNAPLFHLLNVIIHIISVLILFNLIRLILLQNFLHTDSDRNINILSGVLALSFALSYSGSEAVFWISGITSVFQSFFIILVLYLYFLYLIKKKNSYLYISYIVFFIGLGAKEGVFLLIALIPISYFVYTSKIRFTKTIFSWVPYWVIGFIYFIVANRVFMKADKGGGYTFRYGFTLFRNIQQFLFSTFLMTPYNDGALVTAEKKMLSIPIRPRHIVGFDFWVIIGVFLAVVILFIFFSGKLSTKFGFALLFVVVLPLSLPKKHLSGWGAYPYSIRTYYLPAIILAVILAIYFKDIILIKRKKIFIFVLAILMVGTIINGIRVHERSSDWITAGKRYNVILRKLNKALVHVKKDTKRVSIRVVDPTDDKGLYLHYIFPLSMYYKDFRMTDRRFLDEKYALGLSKKEERDLKSGKMQILLYNKFKTKFISYKDLFVF